MIFEELRQIAALLEAERNRIAIELNASPNYNLTEEIRHGKPELLASAYKPSRVRIPLKDKPQLAVALVRKLILKQQLALMEKNIKSLKAVLKRMKEFNPNDFSYELRQKYELITPEIIEEALRIPNADSWAKEDYERLEFMPEEKRHITSRGERMRSKSEALIAELLYSLGIEFRYEAVLYIDGQIFAPDFTIRLASGKIIYWEHMGLTSNRAYVQRQLKKIEKYIEAGIVPWDNLIISWEDAQGNLDIRSIKAIITSRLLNQ